jgi:hypothetical protein
MLYRAHLSEQMKADRAPIHGVSMVQLQRQNWRHINGCTCPQGSLIFMYTCVSIYFRPPTLPAAFYSCSRLKQPCIFWQFGKFWQDPSFNSPCLGGPTEHACGRKFFLQSCLGSGKHLPKYALTCMRNGAPILADRYRGHYFLGWAFAPSHRLKLVPSSKRDHYGAHAVYTRSKTYPICCVLCLITFSYCMSNFQWSLGSRMRLVYVCKLPGETKQVARKMQVFPCQYWHPLCPRSSSR